MNAFTATNLAAFFLVLAAIPAAEALSMTRENGKGEMGNIQETVARLQGHLEVLTREIGERSVRFPDKLEATAAYVEGFLRDLGLPVHREPYDYQGQRVYNIVAGLDFVPRPAKRLLLGAHYDSVSGTVGADDNASAVAVALEVARYLAALKGSEDLDVGVRFVFFALEEPPVYGTRDMGSRVYAARARREKEKIDGMICLEMVGYACRRPGCQDYPFPLMFFGYPKTGDYVGIVANLKSRSLAQELESAFRRNPDLPTIRLTVPLNGWVMPPVRLSDHASFWDKGFKAVMITDGAFYRNPNYHLPSDTMDTLDFHFMAELVESLVIFFRGHRR